jgi:hypothetical protein
MLIFLKSILSIVVNFFSINKVKIIIYSISAIVAIIGIFGIKTVYNNYKKSKIEIAAYKNNQREYENIISKNTQDKRVLELSSVDLKYSNDKLVHTIDSIGKLLKKAGNKPGDVSSGITSQIHDTAVIIIPGIDSCAFDTTIVHNEFTKSRVIAKNNVVKEILDVNNTEYLYVYSSREYVNTYKTFLGRLFHLDWHKVTLDRYDIENTNKLIKNSDIRIIKVRE